MTTKTDIREFITRQTEAWNRHDVAKVAAGYAESANVLDPVYPEPLNGRQAVEKDAADFFGAFPDLSIRVTRVFVDGDSAVYEAEVSGTNTGPLPLPTGLVPPTNRKVTFPVAGVMELDESGCIRTERRYYDVAGQLSQLGLMQ
jgi:steroid delta-isomerase-like uncharacterized protein